MGYLKNIDSIRSVEWGRSYLWDCKFGSGVEVSPSSQIKVPKYPFNTWFPATEVRENLFTLNSKEITGHLSTYKLPQSTSLFTVELTFIDDYKDSLSDWITEWVNKKVLGSDKGYLYPLEEVVAPLYIAKLNLDRVPLHTAGYIVYPEGELFYHGQSEGGTHTYQVTFIIVGSVTEH
jgi:hypothetical protein